LERSDHSSVAEMLGQRGTKTYPQCTASLN
jgi:hypothetical protein